MSTQEEIQEDLISRREKFERELKKADDFEVILKMYAIEERLARIDK